MVVGQIASATLAGLVAHPAALHPARAFRKSRRAFDVAFSVFVLVLTAPLLALAVVALRLESPGAAIFRQRRMGLNGRVFELVKLRGMYVDAPVRFPEYYKYENYPEASALYFHQDGDPRVTRVARILRRYSIDELPNFWNVLRGDMSVVGPRPEIPELTHLYGPHLDLLLSVRPGVTSPAKASGRDGLSLEENLALDLEYIENRSSVSTF